MASRFPSHQLSNGLYVSGRPEQPKEKAPVIFSTAMPYTEGDIKKSGEFGKMFDIHKDMPRKSGPLGNQHSWNASFGGSASNSGPVSNAVGRSNYSGSISSAVPGTGGSARAQSNSGMLNKHGEPTKSLSGTQSGVTPMACQNSGPLPPVLPTTRLFTSGPIFLGPLNSSGAPRKVSGPLDATTSMKMRAPSFSHNQAVTNLHEEDGYSIKASLPKPILWMAILLFVMGFVAGGFILSAVRNPILLVIVVVIFCLAAALLVWNICRGARGVAGFIQRCPDADLRTAVDGQYVKVTGVVTCGNFPLESSFQRVPRCVYTSTCLYEYRGWDSKSANTHHRRFTWGLRSIERHAVDFYISDFQSGQRALVKAGYGARITPYVEESVVIDISPENKERSPEFLRWLRERNLSSDDRIMRLKEGYIKEGSTVSVMGVVQKNNNVQIVPPSEPFSTRCQWAKCIFPTNLVGLVLMCEDTTNVDVIPV